MAVHVEEHAKGLTIRCVVCGFFSAVEAPVDARIFLAKLRAFLFAHESCTGKKHGTTEDPQDCLPGPDRV